MDDDDYFILGLFANLFTAFKTSSHIDKAGILEILADVSYLSIYFLSTLTPTPWNSLWRGGE